MSAINVTVTDMDEATEQELAGYATEMFGMTKPQLNALITEEPDSRAAQAAQIELDRRAAKKAAKRTTTVELVETTIDDALLTIHGFIGRMPMSDADKLEVYENLYNAIENAVSHEAEFSGAFTSLPLSN